tara:strand:+ start:6501 stop:6902 length:402 start_codon:yes stop_codon:yes gene_type:complete
LIYTIIEKTQYFKKEYKMNPTRANLLNSISLIVMGFWGYIELSSPTALIPVVFGIILFLCYFITSRKPHLNMIVSHVAILFTMVILLALVGMRLPKSLDDGGVGLIRVLVMIGTSLFAMIFFIKSFIDARKNR